MIDLLKNLLLKYNKLANLLNDAEGYNIFKKIINYIISPNKRHRDRAGRQQRNLISLKYRPQNIIDIT